MNQDIFSHHDFLNLSEEKKLAIKEIEKGRNVFITGGAGTGKSYLLNFLKKHYNPQTLAITASTGIAAVNISGQTIHSWCKIGLANLPIDQIVRNLFSAKMNKIRRKIQATKILAIDEISMISADIFEIINCVLKAVRQNDKPMGGLQILLFGDFLQLPPISRNTKTDFCFNSKTWQELNLKTIYLQEIHRQEDKKFIKILNNLRFGEIDEDDIDSLKSRVGAKDKSSAIKPTILTTHNARAEKINDEELKKIPQIEKIYEANYFGSEDKIEFLQKNCIAANMLKIKVGAQVMMIKNTYQKDGIINGSLGIVKDFSSKKSYPIVEFLNGKTITIAPEEWTIEKYDEEKKELIVEASICQVPLILSWAITIHKSQGLTLDKISCDLSEIFSPGQGYVALSRARNFEGVFIKSINFNKIKADKEAIEFYNNL